MNFIAAEYISVWGAIRDDLRSVVKIKGNILAILSESVTACSNNTNCGLPALLLSTSKIPY
jgi:hypothetical protein